MFSSGAGPDPGKGTPSTPVQSHKYPSGDPGDSVKGGDSAQRVGEFCVLRFAHQVMRGDSKLIEAGNPTEWKKLHGTNLDAVEYVADVAVLRDTKASHGTVSGNNTLTNQKGTFDSGGAAPTVPGEPDGLGPGFHFDGENFLYLDGHAKWLMHQDPSSAPRLDWF